MSSKKQNGKNCILLKVEIDNVRDVYLVKSEKEVSVKMVTCDADEPVSYELTDPQIASIVSKDTKMKYIGNKWYVDNIYQLLENNLKKRPDRKDSNDRTVMQNVGRSGLSPAFGDPQKIIEDNIKARVVEDLNGSKTANDDSRYMPQTTGNDKSKNAASTEKSSDEAGKALQQIAQLLNDKYHIQMNVNENTSILLDSIKKGLEQLTEGKSDNAKTPAPQVSPSVGNNQTKELNEAYKIAADYKKQNEIYKQQLEANEREMQELQKKIDGLNQTIENDKAEKETLAKEITQLKSNGIDPKGELVAAIDNLISDLQRGEYIFDAEGNVKDNIHLVEQAGDLKQSILECTADNIALLRLSLKDILRKELQAQNGLFEELAKYRAYSQLAFMIEPSDNGYYLVPQRIASIYNKAIAVIAPYGFSQIVPALFVETIEDGDYLDPEGQPISQLAQMCPLLQQHKEKVDRNQRADVITDVVRIGFTEDGKTVEKTKILRIN